MVRVTAFVVKNFEKFIGGCLGSIDITGDRVGTLQFLLSYAYFHQLSKCLSQDEVWNVELEDNRRVGSLTRKIRFRNSNTGNYTVLESTFYDKLLETLIQVGVKGCLNDAMFPFTA